MSELRGLSVFVSVLFHERFFKFDIIECKREEGLGE